MLQGPGGDCCPFSTGLVEIIEVEVGKKKDEVCKQGNHGKVAGERCGHMGISR